MQENTHIAIRKLRDVVDTIGAAVYYSPLAQTSYEQLGLKAKWPRHGSIKVESEGYFCGRCAVIETLDIQQISDALYIFPIDIVANALNSGWAKTSATNVKNVRVGAASVQLKESSPKSLDPLQCANFLIFLVNLLDPKGLDLFKALKDDPLPTEPFARLWRAADLIREYRSGSHLRISALELSPPELLVLTFAARGRDPIRSLDGLGWSKNSSDDTISSLNKRGLLNGTSITLSGKRLRSHIEIQTDNSLIKIGDYLADDKTKSLMSQMEELSDNLSRGDLAIRRRISDN
jgi:hypothetical protein